MADEAELRRRIESLEAEIRAMRAFDAAPYRAVVEDMSELVVRWLPDGTRLFVNEAYCRLFGASRSELVGTSFWPLINESDREAVRRRFAALSPAVPVILGRHRAVGPDGNEIWMEWVDRATFDAQGVVIELHSVGRDITERVQLEEQVRRIESADAVARVSAAIAHDANNMLTVLMGELRLLELRVGQCAEIDTTKVALASIVDLVRRLGSLRFGRVLQPQPIDLNARVERLRGLLGEIGGDGIVLSCDLLAQPCTIQGDATEIDQVLVNLVKNAAEAMPTGGEIRIATRIDAGAHAVLEVADTGAGISASVLPRLFDPNVSTKPNGQGLGLATVKCIVEGHGGVVRVHSSESGARFELCFPAVG
jgi:PAS domain S-box-containing protein